MTHTPKIIEAKQVNNEFVSYRIQCCEDAHEITWHTIAVLASDHDAQLEKHKQDASTRHEAMVKWRAKYQGNHV